MPSSLENLSLRELVDFCSQVMERKQWVTNDDFLKLKEEMGRRSIMECYSW
ncbi:MAG: hypothetical protein RDV48_02640 [Candidatus Eremiobacteraeota bacterium]|nr:hypothetical protein [Candidatus Eremiobacteraeota bacterium]